MTESFDFKGRHIIDTEDLSTAEILHLVKTADDIQAMARVYRQGQQKPCIVYRLFTSGSVEEVCLQRQFQKGNLASGAVDAKKGSLRFSKEELRDCFTLKVGCPCDTKTKVGDTWSPYNGLQSLVSEGCSDSPLMQLASREGTALAFVHVVKSVATSPPDDEMGSSATAEKVAADSDDSSSDDEYEFE